MLILESIFLAKTNNFYTFPTYLYMLDIFSILNFLFMVQCSSIILPNIKSRTVFENVNDPYAGCDNRYPEEVIDQELSSKIYDDMKRKEILEMLADDNYGVLQKVNTIQKYRYLIDVGERKKMIFQDLLDDWNFEIM